MASRATSSDQPMKPLHQTADHASHPLRIRLRLWRNRLLASPGFRNAIARTPLLRAIANRKANDLFRLTGGFIFSQVLLAGVRLGLYETLAPGPLSSGQLAARLGLDEGRMKILLRANADLGLLMEASPDLWLLDDAGVILASDRGLAGMIRHHEMLYRDLTDPDQMLRTRETDTELRRYWSYVREARPDSLGADEVADYSVLMRESQAMMASCILASHDFARVRVLLDVGGGEGAFLAAAAAAHPSLEIRLFDLPAVTDRARDHLDSLGFGQRTQVHGGDFTRDRIPDDADCVTLVRVLCDHDDARVAAILANLHRSLRPGTRLIVAEAMNGRAEGARLASAYFGIYFLAMGSGRCRSDAEIAALLWAAGFAGVKTVATPNPLIATLVTAVR
ncbi:methyltransferase [Rhizobium sp. RU36D]|uniref:methyltransferase n=1 Tax=Rhizobium sp. RU36D TaxID=1907415 RepID=UPI0009D8E46F|nr:methyltransferase [Rhizobium sp. RU36D]SMC53260.1 hydroxyneurosporene-O-methyltransferase [Rhizobium sp. RU36D]